jgi:hypothetical protein
VADFNVRSDSVNVEQIMEQIRARIREKRGVDYTEEQIRELATVKLQKFLDPRGVRSDLLEQFRRAQPPYQPPDLPNFAFEENTLFESHRGPLRFIRRLLNPILKLFFNPNPLIQALHIQSRVNAMLAEREARLEASKRATESLYYELIHNLVVETTRLGIEVKNLTMRAESMSSRLEFNERRARALEGAVVYRPAPGDLVATASVSGAGLRYAGPDTQYQAAGSQHPAPGAQHPAPSTQHPAPSTQHPTPSTQHPSPQHPTPSTQHPTPSTQHPEEGPGQRSRRRRRRRGRRSGPAATAVMGAPAPENLTAASEAAAEAQADAGDGAASGHSPTAQRLEESLAVESQPSETAEPQSTEIAPPAGGTPPPESDSQ